MGYREAKGTRDHPPLPSPRPSPNPLSAWRKRTLTTDYVFTEGLRSKLKDKGPGGSSSIFGGLFTHLQY